MSFKDGDNVVKYTGDYQASGKIVGGPLMIRPGVIRHNMAITDIISGHLLHVVNPDHLKLGERTPVKVANPTESGWLIELAGSHVAPRWLMFHRGLVAWTATASEALRFARRVDAEVFAKQTCGATSWFASEHQWG